MKRTNSRWLKGAAAVALAGMALGTLAGCGTTSASSNEFTVWWYEGEGTGQYIAWDAALQEFAANHPELDIKFELKTWEQIEKSGNTILDSDKAPDLAEWNKGNGTAGVASQAGLLTNLNEYADQYGWADKIAGPLAFGRYTDGVMGTGDVYGVPTYGEYVGWFYNADLLEQYGVAVPTTFDELEGALATFTAAGITPVASADYMLVHLAYALALQKADNQFVSDYQSYTGEIDFNGPEFTFASEKLQEWVQKGYIASNASGATADDAVAAFTSGASPFMPAGTWLDTSVGDSATFNWGKFLQPGSAVSVGSGGNIWVVPVKSEHAALAAEFIELTLSPKYQDMMANNGGLALLADSTTLTDPTAQKSLPLFTELATSNGLGWYPDWPASGYYDILKASVIDLIAGNTNPQQYRDAIGSFYSENIPQ